MILMMLMGVDPRILQPDLARRLPTTTSPDGEDDGSVYFVLLSALDAMKLPSVEPTFALPRRLPTPSLSLTLASAQLIAYRRFLFLALARR